MMDNPRFTLSNVYRQRAGLSGSAIGAGSMTGRIVPLAAIGGFCAGSSTLAGAANLKAVLASASSGSGSVVADLSLIPPTIYHVILHGQSNATGGNAEMLDIEVPESAYMFNGGLRPGGAGANLTSLVPLEEDNTYSGDVGMAGQSVASSLARQLLPALPVGSSLVISCVAVNGAAMASINKGTSPYAHAMAQVSALKDYADGAGADHRVLGVVFIHGETDDQQSNANYGAQVVQLQADFDSDIKAINGQIHDVPLFACPQAGFYYNNTADSANASTIQLYNAAVANPTKILLMSPRYQYCHTDSGVHVDAYGNYWGGNRYGRALARWFNNQSNSHIKFVSAGMEAGDTEVLITFDVPAAPLQWNIQEVLPRPGKGFYFYDDSGSPPEVIDATIEDGDKVRLHLASPSTGSNRRVSYARKIVASGQTPTVAFGAAGNLTDSNLEISEGGYPLTNWCPPFNLPVS